VVASESVALDVLQFERLRDVQPGETVFIENKGVLHNREYRGDAEHTPCIFEFVYFARPDSILDDLSVYKARLRMGEQLAGKIVRDFPEHDKIPRRLYQEPLHRPYLYHAGSGRTREIGAP